MEQTARILSFRRSSSSKIAAQRRQLQEELARTRILTNQAYSSFNHSCDHDLIESYVYEINALQARYNYLLRQVKELEAQP